MKSIEELIRDLSWNHSQEVQNMAIEKLSNLSGKDVILIAKHSDVCSKECWQNASVVLKQIGYPKNQEALPYLMDWFQDDNWSGVSTITELLKEIDPIVLKPHIEKAMLRVKEENDEDWALGILKFLDELQITKMFEDSFIKELRDILNGN
ncbi:hypothetical protein AC623_10795 [Bacillus sp. FJAT-27231]|uniref:DUF5071 domain-containing protein n=1 Tax=Bacillus sp. FJAT-27231 TaxID=1679168 RepID=UPI000670C3DF|nr:DUF5071 domain-containing protein [Bacillus sp. FJAT-27231]KMY54356.1 hypothetical protein AC623_10795 [Bacillus sp. FJAT-27231]